MLHQLDEILQCVQQHSLVELEPLIMKLVNTKICSTDIQQDWLHYHQKSSGDTALLIAARSGKLDIVQFIWDSSRVTNNQKGVNILKQHNLNGKTALHEAAQFGHFNIVKWLIQHGAQIDALKRGDWTPLMLACTKSHLDIVHCLVEEGKADISLVNKDGWTPFHIACREGHLPIVHYLYKLNPLQLTSASKNKRTVLHTAALHGNSAVIQCLMDSSNLGSVLVNMQDSCGSTVLMDVIRSGDMELVQLLLNRYGADPLIFDELGRQCHHIAAECGHLTILRWLESFSDFSNQLCSTFGGNKSSAFLIAARSNHVHILRHYIDQLLHSKEQDDHTPQLALLRDASNRNGLHYACAAEAVDSIKLLLEFDNLLSFTDSPDCFERLPLSLLNCKTLEKLGIKSKS